MSTPRIEQLAEGVTLYLGDCREKPQPNDDRTAGTSGRSPIVKPHRHKWGEPDRQQFKTERECTLCSLVKVTRHEPGEHPWIEFYRGLEKIDGSGTPGCEVGE